MCWLCVADPMNTINGGHAALLAADAAAADGTGDGSESGSGAPRVGDADASAQSSDLVNGLNTADPNDAIDTGIFNAEGAMVINYYFMQTGEEVTFERDGVVEFEVSPELNFSDFEQTQISAALAAIESFIDVEFVEVDNLADAEMEFSLSQTAVADNPGTPEDETVEGDFGSDFNLGFAFFPSSLQIGSAVTLNADGLGWDREAALDDPEGEDGGLLQGGTGLLTVIHEVGHAMGFDHPFEGNASLLFPGLTDNNNDGVADDVFNDAGDFDLNQDIFTAMSQTQGFLDHPFLSPQGFNDTSARSGGMMAIDIAALQVVYGENDSFADGDDTYAIEDVTGVQNFYHSIWDTGGTDEITFGGAADAVIDLRPATLAVEEGGGGFVSLISTVRGGFTIANDVVIENASSGSGDDSLTGNDRANVLSGGEGADTLIGGGDNDTLIGGLGADDLQGGDGDGDFAAYGAATGRVRADLSGAVSGRGEATGDVFTGVEGISGTDFNDILLGDDQANVLIGGDGFDTISGRDGGDLLQGGDLDDVLNGQNGEDTLEGGADDDTLDGGADDDTLRGENGDDILVGGAGADLLDGGEGFDIASYEGSSAAIRLDLTGTLSTLGDAIGDVFVSIERFAGSALDDLFLGDGGDNQFAGGDGDDDLRGAGGDDTLIGGAGGDRLSGASGSDTASYATAGGAVTVDLSGSLAAVGDAVGDTFISIENLAGGAFDDRLRGNNADNVISGDDGADQLFGVRGDDTLSGEAGDDTLFGEDGDDLLNGGAANDRLDGGEGNDTLIGGAGGDVLIGDAGFDIVSYETATLRVRVDLSGVLRNIGDARQDTLIDIERVEGSDLNDILIGSNNGDDIAGAGGDDNMFGGEGGDLLAGEDGADKLFGEDGDDTLDGGEGADRLNGGDGLDVLMGGEGEDILLGGGNVDTASYANAGAGVIADLDDRFANTGDAAGDRYFDIENLLGSAHADDLRGDGGVNEIQGGGGDDTLTGGGGADFFLFALDGSVDTVTDFSQAGSDQLNVSNIDADTGVGGDQGFNFIGNAAFTGVAGELRFEASGGVTTIFGDVDGDAAADLQIELTGAFALIQGDFIL